ncbi:hypothetical protein PHYC_01598 [Phycisphaerales bacterium]|nr:hypothetical protein PHYC_01598 [Phycisphaerales bacterium]
MGRGTGLSGFSEKELMRELGRRKALAAKLRREHEALVRRLSMLEKQIATMERGAPSRLVPTTFAQGHNQVGLPILLWKILQGKQLTVGQIAAAAKKAGYETTARTYPRMVGNALMAHKDLFERVDRGVYTAK